MNYIYDVTLNFNNKLYDYYDWNAEDIITNIKKIPFFKIPTKQLKKINNNKILFDKQFLKTIENKTETYEGKTIKYSSLLSDGKYTIAIKIDNKLQKSSLPLNQQIEITNIIKKQKQSNLNIIILKKEKQKYYKTRYEIENKIYIDKELKNIQKEKNTNKLSYICLECFGKSEKDINKAIYKIKKEIIKNNDNLNKIYEILKLINQT